jgi:transposase InsO family protein
MSNQLAELKIRPGLRWRIRQRLAVLELADRLGQKRAAERVGLCPRTIRRWQARARQGGVQALVPRYPVRRRRRIPDHVVALVAHARRELGYGCARTQVWLRRVHQVSLAMSTIQRLFVDLGLPYLRRYPKRAARQLKLFERPRPGDCVQVEVKFVKVAHRWMYQYTALDDCTRLRVLRLYPHLNRQTSHRFLTELRHAFPFDIRRLQNDNGKEFPLAFALAVEAAGIRHRYIRPRRPQQNGKVERSHRIDDEEFWSRHDFGDFTHAADALRRWEHAYNHERFSLALQGRTPVEKLAAVSEPPAA